MIKKQNAIEKLRRRIIIHAILFFASFVYWIVIANLLEGLSHDLANYTLIFFIAEPAFHCFRLVILSGQIDKLEKELEKSKEELKSFEALDKEYFPNDFYESFFLSEAYEKIRSATTLEELEQLKEEKKG